MEKGELREWLSLTKADAFAYLGTGSAIALLVMEARWVDIALSVLAIVSLVIASVLGMPANERYSKTTNLMKRYTYPLLLAFAGAMIWLDKTR